jgi:hypothetical protein
MLEPVAFRCFSGQAKKPLMNVPTSIVVTWLVFNLNDAQECLPEQQTDKGKRCRSIYFYFPP